MPMITCIECGNEISSEARACPKCKTSSPNGSPCRICNLRERTSLHPDGVVVHPHCVEEVNRESEVRGTCSNCGHDVRFVPQGNDNDYACPNCGHPKTIPTSRCHLCSGRVIVSRSVKGYSSGTNIPLAHKTCSRNPQFQIRTGYFLETFRKIVVANKSNDARVMILAFLELPIAAVKSIVTLPRRIRSRGDSAIAARDQEGVRQEIVRLKAAIADEWKALGVAVAGFVVFIILAIISYNVGVVHSDGGLFRGLFMQLLLIASGFATIVSVFNIIVEIVKISSLKLKISSREKTIW